MVALIAANLRRRWARACLTAGGVAVGVMAVVALLALSAGLNNTAAEFVHLGRADLGLFQRDAGDPTSSVLPLSLGPRLGRQPEVSQYTPIQLDLGVVRGSPGAILLGLEPNGFAARQLVITRGRLFSSGHVMIGDELASQRHLAVGSPLILGHRRFTVSGIFHSGLSYQDSGVMTTLRDAQMLVGRAPSEVTTFAVDLQSQVSLAKGVREIQRVMPGVSAISDPGELARAGANTELISKAVFMMVVLALILGSLAVANTMLSALLERRRELALLKTIGWSGRQLSVLLLGESLAVSMFGTGVGILLGLAASKLLPGVLGLGAFVSPSLTPWGIGRAALIGVAIGTLGALYPIWRVRRMRSLVALSLA